MSYAKAAKKGGEQLTQSNILEKKMADETVQTVPLQSAVDNCAAALENTHVGANGVQDNDRYVRNRRRDYNNDWNSYDRRPKGGRGGYRNNNNRPRYGGHNNWDSNNSESQRRDNEPVNNERAASAVSTVVEGEADK